MNRYNINDYITERNGFYQEDVSTINETFDELPDLIQPTYVEGIIFHSKKETDAMIQYFYTLPNTEEQANKAFHYYQQDIIVNNKFEYSNDGQLIYLEKNGILVALMTAGRDEDMGYFLTISFKN